LFWSPATLDSIACEGALLAHNVVEGKTTSNYTREQAWRQYCSASSDAM
jgi:hypothetical protein